MGTPAVIPLARRPQRKLFGPDRNRARTHRAITHQESSNCRYLAGRARVVPLRWRSFFVLRTIPRFVCGFDLRILCQMHVVTYSGRLSAL